MLENNTMKIVRLALQVISVVSLLFISCEFYLAFRGVNLRSYEVLAARRATVPNYLRQAWDECGWGWERGDYTSEENSDVIQHVGEDGLRCSGAKSKGGASRQVAIFGCSFTFGCGVEDRETFPYLLNERFSDTSFDNYGVSGFGAYQVLLAMRHVLRQKHYDLVVYDMIPLHLTRNVDRRIWGNLQNSGVYKIQPYVELVDNKLKEHTSNSFSWPGEQTFLCVNFFKRVWDAYFFNAYASQAVRPHSLEDVDSWEYKFNKIVRDEVLGQEVIEIPEVSRLVKIQQMLVDEMYEVCRQQDSRFTVAVIENNANLFAVRCEALGKPYKCCLLDPPDSQKAANRVQGQVSNHPGPTVHRAWADNFEPWLRSQGFR
ncbi:MAG: hypothetical protein ACI37J_02655 [Candidatus Bruticola sp.]